ncbi:MAG: ABC transporter permease, partial [Actinobacteria bacterium]|nr:ABC transporter permease [Actinomycetota bacterium]
GWNPGGTPWLAIPAVVLGAFAFGGIGLLMAGTLRGTVTLALANGLYLLLLLLGGMIIPFSEMPGFLGTIGKVLPSGALSQVLQSCLRSGAGSAGSAGSAWIVLAVWAVLAPLAAVKFFRWE